MSVPHQPHLWSSCRHIRREFDCWPGVCSLQKKIQFTSVSPSSLSCANICQVVNRFVGAISAMLWMPFCRRFGTRTSYFVSISIGVAASCVILLPMTAHLFWFVVCFMLSVAEYFPHLFRVQIVVSQLTIQVSFCPFSHDRHWQFYFCSSAPERAHSCPACLRNVRPNSKFPINRDLLCSFFRSLSPEYLLRAGMDLRLELVI